MPAQSKYAVYICYAAAAGWPRAYVGLVDVMLWGGGDALVAVHARVGCHMSGGKTAAAWLRACAGPAFGIDVLMTTDDRAEALVGELYHTLRVMEAHGSFLTRGGPWCRIEVPWAEIAPLRDFARTPQFALFRMRLAAWGGVPSDVRMHLDDRCYLCTGLLHIAEDCEAAAPADWPPAARRSAYAAHFVPVPKAVYYEKASERVPEARWRFSFRAGTSGRARKRLGSVHIERDGDLWRLRYEDNILGSYASEVECTHAGALEATLRCNVDARRCARPAGAPGVGHV